MSGLIQPESSHDIKKINHVFVCSSDLECFKSISLLCDYIRSIPANRDESFGELVELSYPFSHQQFISSDPYTICRPLLTSDVGCIAYQTYQDDIVFTSNIFISLLEKYRPRKYPHAFYSSSGFPSIQDEEIIKNILISAFTCNNSNSSVYILSRFPNAYQSSFSIRHDYDRPLEVSVLNRLLEFYYRKKLKASFFLLTSQRESLAPFWLVNLVMKLLYILTPLVSKLFNNRSYTSK